MNKSSLPPTSIHDINHYLRAEHLQQLTNIVNDPEASPNDRFVAIDLLKNANIAAGGILPMCQDTGTALVMGLGLPAYLLKKSKYAQVYNWLFHHLKFAR